MFFLFCFFFRKNTKNTKNNKNNKNNKNTKNNTKKKEQSKKEVTHYRTRTDNLQGADFESAVFTNFTK